MRILCFISVALIALAIPFQTHGQEPAITIHHVEWDPDREVREHKDLFKGPLIDTHVHVDPPGHNDIPMQSILDIMQETKVERIIVMATPNEAKLEKSPDSGTQSRLELSGLAPDQIMVMVGSEYLSRWFHQAHAKGYDQAEADQLMGRLAQDLDSGRFVGVGEIGLHHFTKWGRQAVINYPSDFAPFQAMVDLVADKGVWLDLHAETYDPDSGDSYLEEVLRGVALMYQRNPGLKLAWSHTAMTNPANVREILLRYPNVIMNFKLVGDHSKWRGLEPICDEDCRLYEDWAQLMEEMPERFVIGTDYKFARDGVRTSKYAKTIKKIRKVLGTLSPKAARLIAYENARSYFW